MCMHACKTGRVASQRKLQHNIQEWCLSLNTFLHLSNCVIIVVVLSPCTYKWSVVPLYWIVDAGHACHSHRSTSHAWDCAWEAERASKVLAFYTRSTSVWLSGICCKLWLVWGKLAEAYKYRNRVELFLLVHNKIIIYDYTVNIHYIRTHGVLGWQFSHAPAHMCSAFQHVMHNYGVSMPQVVL